MRRAGAIAALGLAAAACAATALPAQADIKRPIVYTIVIDGLDGDRVDEGKAPFIGSLLQGGAGASATYYRESRSVMIAETNPNHAAMMTGAYGGSSGIPGNAFALYSPPENEDSCKAASPLDTSKLPKETSGENSNCLQSQTVFEAVKRQGDPDGLLTAAIFGKPKLGRIFAGSFADRRSRDADHVWAPCASGSDDDDYCGKPPTNPATGYAIDDRTVMDEVIRTVRQGVGAERRRPDFTFVNLHQVDSAGHASGTGAGPGSPLPLPLPAPAGPYDAAIAQADKEIERLVNELRSRGEWSRTVMVLLSDHSMDTTTTKTTLTSRFESAGIANDRFLVLDNGSVDMAYVARGSSDRFALLKRMREVTLAQSGVSEALYREPNPPDGGAANTIARVHPSWRLTGDRTGDLVVIHKPGGAFSDPSSSSNPIPGNHGGPQTRDNFFAVVGGGDFVRLRDRPGASDGGVDDTDANPLQAENADVASTVMGLFGLFETRQNRGRFLGESFDLPKLPGRAAPSRRPRLRFARARAKRRSRACVRALRYRLRWSPAGGRYDLELRTGKRHKRLLRNRKVNSYSVKLRRGRRYRFRIRSRAASGVPSAWSRRKLRPPRC